MTVKLPTEAWEKARELSAYASKHGWAAFGIDRDDPPTIQAMFDAAIEVLAARIKKSKKGDS